MMKKKLFVTMLALCMVFVFTACGGSSNEAASSASASAASASAEASASGSAAAPVGDAVTIKVAHWFADGHPQDQSWQEFKKEVEEKSGGSMTVELYGNNQLGSEEQYIDSCSVGQVEIIACGTACAKFAEQVYSAETPFMCMDWDEAKAVFQGDPVNLLFDEGWESASKMYLKQVTVNGFREFSANKKIESMDDFKGLRMRVPNVPNYVKMAEALGASPIEMSLSELFTAMETKTVDGQDNPFPTQLASSFYEVQPYACESRHMFSPIFWCVNQDFYNGLSDDQKAILDEALQNAADHNWKVSEEYDATARGELESKGMEITDPSDEFKAAMAESQLPVYKWYVDNFGGTTEEFFNAVSEITGRAML